MREIIRIIRYRKYLVSLAVVLFLLAAFVPGTPVMAAPEIVLTPSAGATGLTISINGSVFDSYVGDNIRIFFDTQEIPGSPFAVPSNGTFAIDFVIPAGTTPGEHWIEVRSQTSSSSMLAKTVFNVYTPTLTLNPAEGPTGTEIEVRGTGFYVGKTVNISYYNPLVEAIGSKTASDIGEFSHRFVIPPGTGGVHKIAAANAQRNTAEISFKILPRINLSMSSAGPGEPVSIRGTGFGNQSSVTITFGILNIATAVTDALGNFEVGFNVPEVTPISYDVKAQDNMGFTDKAAFTVTAGLKLSVTGGSVGEKITVRGTGFKPGAAITVVFESQRVASSVADNNGDFIITFTVPPTRGGEHIITISDGTTTKKLNFSVETIPPPVPVPLMPADKSLTKAAAYFQWRPVADSSVPVTYSLQIASDQNFSSLALEKTGLAAVEYTLTEKETLAADFKNAAYFWRVKAVDGAGNESAWTAPWVFYVSVPPTPALLLPAADSTAELPIRFSWQTVSSLSPPVTYTLELASDLGFTSLLLDKAGLTVPDYSVSKEHKLKLKNNVIYYWRVKAVDNAYNESAWSASSSFTFSGQGFPGWAVYILIFLAVVIVAILAFRWGRKTAYH